MRLGIRLVASVAALTAVAAAGRAASYAERPLAEALRRLQRQGLPVVFSTSVVPDTILVEQEPSASKPRKLLDQLLAPHGLVARPGPRGRLLVIPAGSRSRQAARLGGILGEVVDTAGEPLSGLVVRIVNCGFETTSSSSGHFRFSGVPEGEQRIGVELPLGGGVYETVEVGAGQVSEVLFRVAMMPIPIDEVVVVSRMSMLREEPAPGLSLDRDEIQALPHFGDDVYRAVKALPGVTGDDFTAGFNVRGGLYGEMLVRLDGLELHDPFHLKDLKGIFSLLDPQLIGGVELLPGSFPVEYGDRSAGVVDVRSYRPSELRSQLGISSLNFWAGSAGRYGEGKGSWLASARRGYLSVVLNLAATGDDAQPQPDYWDVFGRVDRQLTDRHRLAANLLTADDKIDFLDVDGDERTNVLTAFEDRYLWLSHQGLLGPRALVDSVVSIGEINHDRFSNSLEYDETFHMEDLRSVNLWGLRQDWSLEPSVRHFVKLGGELRSFDVLFDFSDAFVRDQAIDDPRFGPPTGSHRFSDRFDGAHASLYLSDRLRLGKRLVAEVGGRYDRQTLVDEEQLSPRLNFLLDLGPRGNLRLGWGHFFQSQRPHELDVPFGETEYLPAQRAEHLTLGWEAQLDHLGLVRVEAYRRRERDPQRRYETLFDPFQPLPQAQRDLVVIDPDRVTAQGVEIYVRGRPQAAVDWWASYTLSSVDDVIDGRKQPRWIDQPHALQASFAWRPGPRWILSALFRYHTGWPTTRVEAEALPTEEGPLDMVWDIGPFYAERLPHYESLDLRISRRTTLTGGSLTAFLDIQNVYGHTNRRGIEIDERHLGSADGRLPVRFETANWLTFLPSFGVSWEF